MPVKELKSLEEHNAEAGERRRGIATHDDPWRPCDLRCLECGKELLENKMMMLMSDPPQRPVRCGCGFSGYKA